ncbi:hypothetical protein ABBQ38_003198 [Trebouxia sp. C0009 RCD-2024]
MSRKRATESADEPSAKRQAVPTGPDLDRLVGVPAGWRQCPKFSVLPSLRVIACKVPLSSNWSEQIIGQQDRFTPEMLLAELEELGIKIGMVVDLTNSSRYYTADADGTSDFRYPGPDPPAVYHRKIPCRGRGQAPQPDAVNEFCWTLTAFNQHCQREEKGLWTIVHCTHGYNRTGYVIASALMRLERKTALSAVKYFADNRPPGIYKRHYIEELFKYSHELLPVAFPWPQQPEWKDGDEDDVPDLGETHAAGTTTMQHDDVIGEEVCQEEAEAVQTEIVSAIMGPAASELRFPGSQPVSLAASNTHLLSKHRYYVTWKADGTRYMLYISVLGTYLVDRSFSVRRVQMRWPTAAPKTKLQYDPEIPQHGTLLDGEMIVDEDKATGKQARRYLAYDIMQLCGRPLRNATFKERWNLIEDMVVLPRNMEREVMNKDMAKPPHQQRFRNHYLYQQEPFSMRRKQFWPIDRAEYLMNTFIPEKVSHEADGLILQPWVGERSHYIPNTCEEVLKWKYAHLNSVDFRFRLLPGGTKGAELLLLTRGGEVPIPGAKVVFPDKEDAIHHNGEVIECSWDAKQESWTYMRDRRDKKTPNAWHVYEKVLQSIKDDITPSTLVDIIQEATHNNIIYTASTTANGKGTASTPFQGHGHAGSQGKGSAAVVD